jgi:hypothetical protein
MSLIAAVVGLSFVKEKKTASAARKLRHWRNRAEQVRLIAETMQDEQAKRLMLSVAKDISAWPNLPRNS